MIWELETLYEINLISQYNDYALTPDEIKTALGDRYNDYIKDVKQYSTTAYAKASPGFAGSLETDTTDISKLRFGARQLLERFRWNESMGSPYEYLLENSNKPQTKANGGKVGKTSVPSKNYLILKDGAKLLLNDDGTTSGSHEEGDNIPLKKNNKVVAYAEPGEVLVDDVVLSKRLGFADRYLHSDNMKKSIIKEQKMLPKYNASLSRKLNLPTKRLPFAAGGMDLNSFSNGAINRNLGSIYSGIGTISNLLLSNAAANDQRKMVDSQIAQVNAFTPQLLKTYRYDDTLDVSDMTSEIDRGYLSETSNLDLINDLGVRNALRNKSNISRLNMLSKVFGEKNRIVNDIRNKNVDIIRDTNARNINTINETAQYKLEGNLAGLNSLMAIRAQKLANYQGGITEFNSIINDKLSLDSIIQRYSQDIKDRGLPSSMQRKSFNNKTPRYYRTSFEKNKFD